MRKRHTIARAALASLTVAISISTVLPLGEWIFLRYVSSSSIDPSSMDPILWSVMMGTPAIFSVSLSVGLCVGLMTYFSIVDKE
jgi:hypothetical protein